MIRKPQKKDMAKSRKIFVSVYAAVCLMLVALVVMYRFAAVRDYRDRSTTFNAAASGIFAGQGITDAREMLVTERSAARKRWREYSRYVLIPETADRIGLLVLLREAAKKNGLTLTVTGSETDTFTARAEAGGLLLSMIEARVQNGITRKQGKKVAIVIDDVGPTRDISALLGLGVPVTLAIMPYERHSKDVARELTEKNMPFILHLPMEPERYPAVDPGKAALLLAMTEAEVRKKFASDLAAVPGVCGVSNHMGSAYSEDEPKMRYLLGLVKEQGLFYFDSYTTQKTRAADSAREVGLPFAENGLFMDLQDDPAFMKKQLASLKRKVLRTGRGIVIGHIQKKYVVPALTEAIPEFKREGIEFVYLKDLVQVLQPTPAGTLVRKNGTHEHPRH